MAQLSRRYDQNIGDISDPDKLEYDIDAIMEAINEGLEGDNIAPDAIVEEHILDGAVVDSKLGLRTVDDAVEGSADNTGTLTSLLSWIVRTIKEVKGSSTWLSTVSSLTELWQALTLHKSSDDHDNRYYPKEVLDNHRSSGDHDDRYYTKDIIDPYLHGGDTLIHEEVFTIISPDNGDGTFDYVDRHGVEHLGGLTDEGYQVFALQDGKYIPGENKITAKVNDTLHRSVASGGLAEIDQYNVALTSPEGEGAEITVRYFERVGLIDSGGIIMSVNQPPDGFFWFKVVE